MDVARTLLVLIIAVVNAGLAFAAPSDWSNVGPTTAPTISASQPTYDRYGNPQPGPRSAAGPPPSISERTQNAVSETATTLRDGFQAGVRAAGQQLSRGATQTFDATRDGSQGINQQFQDWSGAASRQFQSAGSNLRSAAEQTLGSTGSQAKYSNPFATTAATPVTNPQPRGGAAPPPWPSSSNAASNSAAPSWVDTSAAVAPSGSPPSGRVSPTSNNGGWTSIGSNVAAPPLLVPQLPASNNNVVPAGNTDGRGGTMPLAENSRTQQPIHSVLSNPSQQPTTTTTRSTNPADDWATGGNNNPDTSRATIGRGRNNSPLANSSRGSDLVPVQPVAATRQDSKNANGGKSNDPWTDDPWVQPPQASQNASTAPAASTAGTKPASITSSNNTPPAVAPAATPPSLNPPTGSSTTNIGLTGAIPSAAQAGTNANATQPVINGNQSARNQSTAPAANVQQPWVPLIVSVLSLAGSLAANLFLGWSYLDARQRYQTLVRKTADTFRRVKPAAAA